MMKSRAALILGLFILSFALLLVGGAVAQTDGGKNTAKGATTDTTKDVWQDWRFLIGDWVAEPDNYGGTGTFSLKPDLQNTILVRTNHADYPANAKRPAVVHDDLMTVYRDAQGAIKALYLDNEKHAINYTATFSEDKSTLTFLSDPSPATPLFRLTYVKQPEDKVLIKFEIAPPGQPEAFKEYLSGTAHRTKP